MDIMNVLFANHWYWLIGGAALIGLELLAPGVFLLWIGVGAVIVGLALTFFPDLPTAAQLIILSVAMIGSVLAGVRLQSRKASDAGGSLNAGLTLYVGRHVVAMEDFENGRGRVRVDDTSYQALSSGDVVAGQSCLVVSVEGGKFRVQPAADK